MRKATTCAQAIQRGNVHRGSGIGIGCAAAASILDLQAEFVAGFFCQFDKMSVVFVAFKGF